jgi:pimeloyl-ACP methyl ester carboxylesterase
MNGRLPPQEKYFGPEISSRHDVSELYVECGDCNIRSLRLGSGPPLILIHGLLAYSFSWRYNLDAFAESHTVYALDLAGVGFSERKAGLDVSLRGSAERLLRFMDALNIGAADLLGTSHGGALSILAASLAPERFDRLVLVDPVNPWSNFGRLRIRVFSTALGAACMKAIMPGFTALHSWALKRMYADRRKIKPGTLEGYEAPLRMPGIMDHLLGIVKTWRADLREIEPALARIADKPVLLIWGERDGAVDPRSARELMKRLPNAQLKFFPGVGHLPYEEAPEEFNRMVLEFLSKKF